MLNSLYTHAQYMLPPFGANPKRRVCKSADESSHSTGDDKLHPQEKKKRNNAVLEKRKRRNVRKKRIHGRGDFFFAK